MSLKNNQDELKYEIGRVCLSFDVKHEGIKEIIKLAYKDYVSCRKPDISIDVEYKDNLVKPRFETLIFQTKAWKIGTVNNQLFFYLPCTDKKSSCLAWFSKSLDSIKCYTEDCSGRVFLSFFPDILFSLILPQKKILMLHGCGALSGKKCYLFMAKSGGGKSTIAKLALKKGLKVLNDDRIIVRREKDLFKIYGNPWCREVENTSKRSSFIKEVFFLKKSKFNKIEPMSKSEAMIEFLNNNHCIPMNKEITKERFNICSNLAEDLKCYWLSFRADKSIWGFLDGLAK